MSLQLTTQQLDYLIAAASWPTWSEAAHHLDVTPSALSQGLAELERRLGLALFERAGRRRTLTDDGRQVLDYARRINGLTADLDQWAETARQGDTGLVRLGLIDVAAVYHFPQALTRFRTSRPGADLRLTIAPSGVLLEQLRGGQLDVAIMVEPPRPVDGIATAVILTEDMGIYAPPGTAVGPPSSWGPWVTFPAASHTRQQVAAELRSLGAEYRVEAESNQPEVLRQLVALGMGWTVLPVIQAEAEPAPLRQARSAPLLQRRLVIAQRESSAVSPATNALLQLVMTHSRPKSAEP
jgi:DNA-binding transcriptional LysR family regulator